MISFNFSNSFDRFINLVEIIRKVEANQNMSYSLLGLFKALSTKHYMIGEMSFENFFDYGILKHSGRNIL